MDKGKKGQTKQDEPTAIPLTFDEAVGGLLRVDPKKSREKEAGQPAGAEEKPDEQEG